MTEPTPAGWYPDPGSSGRQRYWDGNAWTEIFAPDSEAAASTAQAAKKPIYKRTWFIVVAVLFGLAVIGNMVNSAPSPTPESMPSATQASQPSTEAVPAVAVPEPVEESAVPEPTEPKLTVGQQQAVAKAQTYLDMGGFSRKSLIKQLQFEEFSKADATFAIDSLKPDWNAQAAQKAQSYMDMGGFSRKSLIKQLEFEGFTEAQAKHGAKSVGY